MQSGIFELLFCFLLFSTCFETLCVSAAENVTESGNGEDNEIIPKKEELTQDPTVTSVAQELERLKLNFAREVSDLKLQLNELRAELVEFKKPKLKCPSPERISPCACRIREKNLDIACTGQHVTQSALDHVFHILRILNNIGPSDILDINSVFISETVLERLDLSPLLKTRMNRLQIQGNFYLKLISGPTSPNKNTIDMIDAMQVGIYDSPRLTDDGLGNFLNCFSSSITNLYFAKTGIHGGRYQLKSKLNTNSNPSSDLRSIKEEPEFKSESESEFLPGLSHLKNLTVLSISSCRVQELSGGQFRWNNRLKVLNLWGNDVMKLGGDAFLMEMSPEELLNVPLEIDLSSSLHLTVESFGNQSAGLLSIKRPVDLYLWTTSLNGLPEHIFKPFLLAHVENKLNLYQTPLICNEKMSWLKKEVQLFKKKVLNANCVDHDGKMVFD